MFDRPPPLLEQWYRDVLTPDVLDISASGVPALSLGTAMQIAGLTVGDLEAVTLEDGESLGIRPLREAVADAWAGGDTRRVMAAQGSNEVIFLTLHALLRPGDVVVAQQPLYHAYGAALADIGCRVRPWSLREDDGFAPDVEALTRTIDARTRAVIVNFPHNPTGLTVSPAQQRRICAAADRVGAYLIWDTALAELCWDAPPLPDPAACSERALSIGTLSKAYGLPGLRVGWCIGPGDVLAATSAIRDRTTLFSSPLVEYVAAAAVRRRTAFRDVHTSRLRRNRKMILDWTDTAPEVSAATRPAGGVTTFVEFAGVPDTRGLCAALAASGTVLVPGAAFGCARRVRLGFGGPTDQLRRGLDEIAAQLCSCADAPPAPAGAKREQHGRSA